MENDELYQQNALQTEAVKKAVVIEIESPNEGRKEKAWPAAYSQSQRNLFSQPTSDKKLQEMNPHSPIKQSRGGVP